MSKLKYLKKNITYGNTSVESSERSGPLNFLKLMVFLRFKLRDRLEDKHDHHLHTEFLQSITLSHDILKGLDGIAETLYTYDFKHHQWANYLNAAMQLSVAQNLKFETGLNYGFQADAEKSCFIGTSFRF